MASKFARSQAARARIDSESNGKIAKDPSSSVSRAALPVDDYSTKAQLDEAVTTAKVHSDSTALSMLSAANTYTDQRFQDRQTGIDELRSSTNERFRQVNRRMDRTGAMSQMGVAPSGASASGRIAADIGMQGAGRRLLLSVTQRASAIERTST